MIKQSIAQHQSGLRWLLLLMAVGTSLACARSAELSGDIFVRMQSGDVKHGADVEVILVPASPEFEQKWKNLVAGFQSSLASTRVAYDQALAQQQELSGRHTAANAAAAQTDRVAEGEEARATTCADPRASCFGAVAGATRRRFGRLRAQIDREAQQAQEKNQMQNRINEAREAIASTIRSYQEEAEGLLRRSSTIRIHANVSGRYTAKDVARGKYYLHARFDVFDNHIRWMVPIEIKDGQQTMDLSSNNAHWELDEISKKYIL